MPPPQPSICWLLNSTRASWFWVLGLIGATSGLFYRVNWVWLLFFSERIKYKLQKPLYTEIFQPPCPYYLRWGWCFVWRSFTFNFKMRRRRDGGRGKTAECSQKIKNSHCLWPIFQSPADLMVFPKRRVEYVTFKICSFIVVWVGAWHGPQLSLQNRVGTKPNLNSTQTQSMKVEALSLCYPDYGLLWYIWSWRGIALCTDIGLFLFFSCSSYQHHVFRMLTCVRFCDFSAHI